MKKIQHESFDSFKVRLGGNDVRVVMSAHPFWKQVEFTATGLRKLQNALSKHMLKVLGETEAREAAERKAEAENRKTKQLFELRNKIADDALASYNFEELKIVDSDGWETETGSNDWNKNVYAENPEGGNSILLSFHVVFDNKKWSQRVSEAYCLDFNTGVMVGKE